MRIHSDLRRRGRGEAKSARGAVREADRGTDTRWQAREAVTRTQLTSSRGGGRIRKEAGGGRGDAFNSNTHFRFLSGYARAVACPRLLPPASEAARSAISSSQSQTVRELSDLFGWGPEGVFSTRSWYSSEGPSCVFGTPRLDFRGCPFPEVPSPLPQRLLSNIATQLGTGWVLNKHLFYE